MGWPRRLMYCLGILACDTETVKQTVEMAAGHLPAAHPHALANSSSQEDDTHAGLLQRRLHMHCG